MSDTFRIGVRPLAFMGGKDSTFYGTFPLLVSALWLPVFALRPRGWHSELCVVHGHVELRVLKLHLEGNHRRGPANLVGNLDAATSHRPVVFKREMDFLHRPVLIGAFRILADAQPGLCVEVK